MNLALSYEANHKAMIPENLLLDYGASLEKYDASEIIVSEKKRADFYFQI